MELLESLRIIGGRALEIGHKLETEEATKTSLILPFIAALGYDIHNPVEIVPEYNADFGTKKGEKVDFAICVNGTTSILIECKKYGLDLDSYTGQLYRYYSVTEAKIAILTDGVIYKFFSDLEEENKLDKEPFYVLNLCTLKETAIKDLNKITKSGFDLEGMLSAALDLKYVREFKGILRQEFKDPTWLVMEIAKASSFRGHRTQGVVSWFSDLAKRAIVGIQNEDLKRRLNLLEEEETQDSTDDVMGEEDPRSIDTTIEEIEGFHYIRAALSKVIDPGRIFIRDTHSYCGILVDNNNRKPVCRMFFNDLNKKRLRIGRRGKKVNLSKVSDVLNYTGSMIEEIMQYIDLEPEQPGESQPAIPA